MFVHQPQSDVPSLPRGAKRQRLATACLRCRQRKVRCDEQQPQCRNCALRGEHCDTTDVRDPGREVVRRRTNGSRETSQIASPTSQTRQQERAPPHESSTAPHDRRNIANSFRPRSERCESTDKNNNNNGENHQGPPLVDRYDHDMILHTDSSAHRRKLLGGSSLQALAKVIDRYFARKGWELVTPKFAFGMQHVEEVPLPKLGAADTFPALPSLENLASLIDTWTKKIHPLYPIFNLENLRGMARAVGQQQINNIAPEDIPYVAILYAISGLCSDEQAGQYTEIGWIYLRAAYSLYAYILAMPYFTSVQAMLVITIGLKSRNKDGAGWQTLSSAIRIAQSLGLHVAMEQNVASTPGSIERPVDNDLDARVWWAAYCIEKLMGLESGRPSGIRDEDCTQVVPANVSSATYYDFQYHWIGLARIQSSLLDALYHRSNESRNAQSLIQDIARIDRELCDWAKSVTPEHIRPSSELLCQLDQLPFATMLSIYYHQTLINVHRAALMVDMNTYRAKIEQYCPDSLSRDRLLGSENILISSARRIANLQVELSDKLHGSRILTMTQIMLAMMVLGFYIMKHPEKWRNRLDVELLSATAHYAASRYTATGQHPEFIQGIQIFKTQIQWHVYGNVDVGQSFQQNESLPSLPQDVAIQESGSSSIPQANQPFGNQPYEMVTEIDNASQEWSLLDKYGQPINFDELFADLPLDDPWQHLLSAAVISSEMNETSFE